MKKFQCLTNYLLNQASDSVVMTFEEIERVIGEKLPESAHKHRAYFSNTFTHSIAKAWLIAGYESQDVDIYEGKITFVKSNNKTINFYSLKIFKAMVEMNLMGDSVAITSACLEALMASGTLTAKEVNNYIDDNHIAIYGEKGEPITFLEWYESRCNCETYPLIQHYRDFSKTIWITILINIMDPDEIIENTAVDFFMPKIGIDDSALDTKTYAAEFNKLYKLIRGSDSTRSLIDSIAKLSVKEIKWPIFSKMSMLNQAYIRHAVELFINNSDAYLPWVPPQLFLEMIDVGILNNVKGAKYITEKAFGLSFLLGKSLDLFLEDPAFLAHLSRQE